MKTKDKGGKGRERKQEKGRKKVKETQGIRWKDKGKEEKGRKRKKQEDESRR